MRVSGKPVWFLTLLINLIWLLAVFASLNESQIYTYFNSDTLYLPSIFRDLFYDRSGFRGWHLNAAPNFFPDMPVYFLFNALAGDFKLAMVIFSISQYMFLLLLLNYLLRQLVTDISWYQLSAANLIMLVLFFVTVCSGDFVFTFYILSISYHLGAFIMTVLCLAFTVNFLKGRGNKYLYLLMAFVFLASLSNRLFIVMFVIPSLAVLPFLAFRDRRPLIYRFILSATLSSFSGIVAFNLIKASGYLHFVGTQGKIFNFPNIVSSFNVMTGQHLRYLQLMDFRGITVLISLVSFMLTCLIAVTLTRKLFLKGNDKQGSWLPAFYSYYSSLFFVIVLFMPVINGSYVGWAILRYNIYAFYLALFNYGFIIWFFLSEKTATRRVFDKVMVVVVIVMSGYSSVHVINNRIGKGISAVVNYYPAWVACIDEFAEENDLRYGVAEYWYAKMTTMFSKNDVRLYTVHHDMAIWYHVMNRNWYYKNRKGVHANPEFRFVVANSLDSASIAEYYGDPLQEYRCEGNLRMLEYPEFIFDPSTRRSFFPDKAEQQDSQPLHYPVQER